MNHKRIFEKKLEELFHSKTHSIRKEIGIRSKAKTPDISRTQLLEAIKKLKNEVVEIRGKYLMKKAFKEHAPIKKRWRIKGAGEDNKKSEYNKWCTAMKLNPHNFIYIFWNKHKCLYVGRSDEGIKRPTAHMGRTKYRFATHLDIYPTLKSYTSKLECLAIHYLNPNRNKVKGSKKKNAKNCPICKIWDNLETDLKNLFRIKH